MANIHPLTRYSCAVGGTSGLTSLSALAVPYRTARALSPRTDSAAPGPRFDLSGCSISKHHSHYYRWYIYVLTIPLLKIKETP
jgi:hypothetical protein